VTHTPTHARARDQRRDEPLYMHEQHFSSSLSNYGLSFHVVAKPLERVREREREREKVSRKIKDESGRREKGQGWFAESINECERSTLKALLLDGKNSAFLAFYLLSSSPPLLLASAPLSISFIHSFSATYSPTRVRSRLSNILLPAVSYVFRGLRFAFPLLALLIRRFIHFLPSLTLVSVGPFGLLHPISLPNFYLF
jgi:hypothetical protein